MKRKIFYLIALSGIIGFSACKKDSKNPTADLKNTPFATESVAQGKTNLSNNGDSLIAQMNVMKDAAGFKAMASFASFVNQSSPSGLKSTSLGSALNFAQGNNDARMIYSKISSSLKKSAQSDPNTLQGEFDAHKGIFTWNSSTSSWDSTASANSIEFLFPSDSASTVNNAHIIVTYTGIIPVTSSINNYNGDLPSVFLIQLKISDVLALEYGLNATYNTQGVPSALDTHLSIPPFKLEYSLTNTNSTEGMNIKLTNSSKTLIDLGYTINGNFSTIQQYADSSNINDPGKILSNANAHIQIMNIKIAGVIDFTKILNAEKNLFPSNPPENYDYTAAEESYVKEFNNDAVLVVVYVDTNKKIAQAEAYLTTDDLGNSSMNFRFVFADGSKGDLNSYFGQGFDDLKTQLDNLKTSFK